MKTKLLKRQQAVERQEYWDQFAAEDKWLALDSRLGPSVGAQKQRGRLIAAIRGDLDNALEYAEAYGAGPATIAAIRKAFDA